MPFVDLPICAVIKEYAIIQKSVLAPPPPPRKKKIKATQRSLIVFLFFKDFIKGTG